MKLRMTSLRVILCKDEKKRCICHRPVGASWTNSAMTNISLLWKPSGDQWGCSLSALICVYSCSHCRVYYIYTALCVCLVEFRSNVSFVQLNNSPLLSTDFSATVSHFNFNCLTFDTPWHRQLQLEVCYKLPWAFHIILAHLFLHSCSNLATLESFQALACRSIRTLSRP